MTSVSSFGDFYKEARRIIDSGNVDLLNFSKDLESYLSIMTKLKEECTAKLVEEDFTLENVQKTDMRWADYAVETDVESRAESHVESHAVSHVESHAETQHNTTLNNIDGAKCSFTIPVVEKLEELKPALAWFAGDSSNKEGIYTAIAPNLFVQVPFPNVKDITRATITQSATNIKKGSIKCRYETIEKCEKIRKNTCQQRGIEYHDCDYAHIGDKYVKIGYGFRCPNVPSFGTHASLNSDMRRITDRDIKIILMYALSDVLLSSMWWQSIGDNGGPKTVLNDIDVCI